MKRRLWSLLLALTMVLSLTACQDVGIIGGENGPTDITIGDSVQAGDAQTGGGDAVLPETPEEPAIDEDGTYDSRDEVALYLWTYGHLPDNYITKSEARDLGWTGGSVETAAPAAPSAGTGSAIGRGCCPRRTTTGSATSTRWGKTAGGPSVWSTPRTALTSTIRRTTTRALLCSTGRNDHADHRTGRRPDA